MNASSPLPCAGLCRHFAPESSHCRLHGKGIEAPFEQRCDQHELTEPILGRSHFSLLIEADAQRV